MTIVRSSSERKQYYFTPNRLTDSVKTIVVPTVGAKGSKCNAHVDGYRGLNISSKMRHLHYKHM